MKGKILVIDDEPSIHSLMDEMLSGTGLEVRCAFGEDDGLELARRWAPDLVLLDIVLVKTTGFALATKLQKISAAPVLFITGNCGPDTVKDARLLGVREVLRKPLEARSLTEALQRHLRTA